MIDTCNGCGKHPSVCMCRTTVPPDIEELLNRRKSLAAQLKQTAYEHLQNKIKMKSADIISYVLHEAQEKASCGEFKLTVWLDKIGCTVEQAEKAAESLRQQGFKCEVTNEVTAYYSNTDWDQEDVMHVSWE